MSWFKRTFAIVFLVLAASTARSQSISGSTTVDIDPDTGMVTATCETDVDGSAQGYYDPRVTCVLTDDAGNNLASGYYVDNSGSLSAVVFLQVQGVPGTTYTATARHYAGLSLPTDAPEGDPCGYSCQVDEYNFQEISNEFFNGGVPYPYPVTFYGPGPVEETPLYSIEVADTTASGLDPQKPTAS